MKTANWARSWYSTVFDAWALRQPPWTMITQSSSRLGKNEMYFVYSQSNDRRVSWLLYLLFSTTTVVVFFKDYFAERKMPDIAVSLLLKIMRSMHRSAYSKIAHTQRKYTPCSIAKVSEMIWTNANSATEMLTLNIKYFWSFPELEQVRLLQLTYLSRLVSPVTSSHYLILSA